ncbi:hypothetical protein MACJ_001484 [Theileria orientalis]|uniref:6-Cys domain-containing protein n=1 Tax=Theileria orientalis TaxID=68886 RepID=A0A976M8D1_THEOR|nr:hypothetical protein MACJ_001484 [Theileria orientalis]
MKLINSVVSFLFVSLFSFASSSSFDFSSIGEAGLSAVKNKVAKATQFALNYTVFNKTLSFRSIDDFKGGEGNVLSYTLPPGSALKLFCGNEHTRKSGLITLYPPNLTTHTLAPMSKGGIHESLGRVMKNFDVYRSDRTLVHSSPQWFGGSYMFQHPYSSTIVSKDPNFTLNVACVYNLDASEEGSKYSESETGNGNQKNILYKWIEIKFTGVLPISYGCGTGNYPLFSNLSPVKNPLSQNGPPQQTSTMCDIEPEPGMIVGIYCSGEDKFDDRSCFMDSQKMTYYDPEFEHANKPGKLHLFKIPDTGLEPDLPFSCKCRDSKGDVTGEVRVVRRTVHVCDFTRLIENLRPRQVIPLQLCRHNLHPGESLRLIAPPNHSEINYMRKRQLSTIEPSDLRYLTYVQPLGARHDVLAKIEDIMVTKGFTIEKVATRDRLEYLFKYEKDSILIHKTEATGLSYFWTMMDHNVGDRQHIHRSSQGQYINGLINIGLVPTDPYTLGCGIRNEFFRNDFVDFSTTSENNRVVSSCTVDANKGPVGFYCPSPYLLEPRGCFNSVIVEKAGENGETSSHVRVLRSVLKNARAHKSANLVILEFYKNVTRRPEDESGHHDSEERSFDPNFDALVCKCVDVKGNTLASIKVLNPNKEIPESLKKRAESSAESSESMPISPYSRHTSGRRYIPFTKIH